MTTSSKSIMRALARQYMQGRTDWTFATQDSNGLIKFWSGNPDGVGLDQSIYDPAHMEHKPRPGKQATEAVRMLTQEGIEA